MQVQQYHHEEELAPIRERLAATEGEKERIFSVLKEMKKAADDANGKLTEVMSNGKVADAFSKLNSALSKSHEELKNRESTIKALKAELGKAKGLEIKMAEKDGLLEKLKEELSNVKSSEARALDLLSKSKGRIQELESDIEKGKISETAMLDTLTLQTKQLEQTKMLLEESKLEVSSLEEGSPDKKSSIEDDESLFQGESGSFKSKLRSAKEILVRAEKENEKGSPTKPEDLVKEVELLKIELKQAVDAEENSKKAMDDLVFALKEVATEANQTMQKFIATKEELENLKKESEELRKSDLKNRILLDEARKEADLYRNTADRLRLEADEFLHAWNGKQTGFVECIRITEEEKVAAVEENVKLLEALKCAENMNKTAKQENQKLRDILKQALNEANVAKEAAGIARSENSQLKDLLAEKDDALIFITRENENLRINEVAAMENIKELKRLLIETSKEFKQEEKEHNKLKLQNSIEKDQSKEKKLTNSFTLNLKDLIINTLHYAHDQDQKIHEKHNEIAAADSDNADPLKGSIFDITESPVAAHIRHHQHHHRRNSSTFAEDGEAIYPEDLENLEGVQIDDLDNEKNPKKKRALLRRFGDIIIRRKGYHRRESSMGGEGSKKELSVVNEGHKKDSSSPSAGDQSHRKEFSEPAVVGGENQRKYSSE